jgi:hypothetical protein
MALVWVGAMHRTSVSLGWLFCHMYFIEFVGQGNLTTEWTGLLDAPRL